MALEFKYWAFISYSHTDKKWGDWLHGALETYKVPKALVGKETARGEPVPSRVFPIFRDREELPTSADLGSVISEALKQSRYLVVICSPRAAQSHWVNQEILDYKKLGRENRILALIVDGEPNAADGKSGVAVNAECFPETLKHPLRPDGELDKTLHTEPIAADARPDKDGKINAKLKLLAGILGVNYDDLKRRDEQRRRRQQRILISFSVALILIFATLAGTAVWQWRQAEIQRKEADKQKNEAVHTLARSDFLQAVQLIRQQKEDEALIYLARSLRVLPQDNPAAPMIFSLLTYRTWPNLEAMFSSSAQPLAYTNTFADTNIMTSNEDGTLRFWDALTGLPLNRPVRHGVTVRSAVFSPDGSHIATAALGAGIWNGEGQSLVSVLPHDIAVRFVSFSPDGSRFVTASENHTACVFDTKTGRALTRPMTHDSYVYSAVFSPDGKQIVTASFDKTARVWDAQTGLPITGPLQHGDAVHSAVFSPDGSQILTACFDGASHVWDIKTEKQIFQLQHRGTVYMATFSPDGSRILTASSDKTAMVWDAKTGQPFLKNPIQHDGIIYSAKFSPDGSRIVTASEDHTARVWNALTGNAITAPLSHDDSVGAATFSPDGSRVVTASDDGTARIWDATTGHQLSLPLRHDGYYVYTAVFSPDGLRILTMADDGIVRIWDAKIGQAYPTIPIPLAQMTNKLAAVATKNNPPSFAISATNPDTNGYVLIHGLTIPTSQLASVYSPDHLLNAQFFEDFIQVLDVQTSRSVFNLNLNSYIASATFNADSLKLLITAGNFVYIYEAKTGKLLAPPLQHNGNVLSASFNPDGSRIVTTSQDGYIRIWDSKTGQLFLPPLKPNGGIGIAIFSPDGTRVLADSGELWSAETGLPLTVPVPGASTVSGTFSPDGLQFKSQNSLQTIDLPPDGDSPGWLPDLAETVARHEMDNLGNTKNISFERISNVKAARLASTSNDPWEKFGRWFFSEPDVRTISPWSRMTAVEYIQHCIAGYDKGALDQAKLLAYGHPDEITQIATRMSQIKPRPAPPGELRTVFSPDK